MWEWYSGMRLAGRNITEKETHKERLIYNIHWILAIRLAAFARVHQLSLAAALLALKYIALRGEGGDIKHNTALWSKRPVVTYYIHFKCIQLD